jgi:NADH-quinone oxidoreductase subunit E
MLKEKYAAEIAAIFAKYPPERKKSATMPLLYLAQKEYGYCSDEAIREVADLVGSSPTDVKGVVGFYTMYYEKPVGKVVIDVCDDLPCALRGADKFVNHCENRLGIKAGEITPDGKITLNVVMCLAACDRAPLAQVNGEYAYDLDVEKFDKLIEEIK